MKLNSLCPTHTLENIQRLLSPEYSDLGRIGSVDVSDGFRDIDSQLLQDLLTGGDDKSDGELNGKEIFALIYSLKITSSVNGLGGGVFIEVKKINCLLL